MIDKRLTFGALSPEIFNKITQAIREIINSKCFKTVCYLDDFLIIPITYNECQSVNLDLRSTVTKLMGLYKKVLRGLNLCPVNYENQCTK